MHTHCRDRFASTSSHWSPARLFLATLGVAVAVRAGAQQQPAEPLTAAADSAVLHWARTNAIPLRSVDAPYLDSSFAFLRPLVGNARILAVGELVHGSHEPLAFRNEVIRYAVTHLGFTAVALETGLTEAMSVDRFIQGGPGNIDSIVRRGLTWQFETLPENRDLVAWLRAHNAQATRKVHFYGLDITGGNDTGMFPGAPGAVLTTLQYLAKVSPATESRLGGRLRPLMDRFMPTRYAAYSPADRDLLRVTLDSVYQRLATDSSRYARATSPRAFAYGLRSAWMAIRVNDLMARGVAAPDGMIRAALTLRDSTMAENTQWALDQEGPHGRVVVFAHNGHVLNTTAEFDSVVVKLLGYRLRARFDTNVVILGSTAGTIVGGAAVDVGGWVRGSGESKADSTTFTALLAKVGLPTFVLVGRSADRLPDVAAALEKTWPFVIVGVQSVVPRRTFDAIVYFDRVSPAKLRE